MSPTTLAEVFLFFFFRDGPGGRSNDPETEKFRILEQIFSCGTIEPAHTGPVKGRVLLPAVGAPEEDLELSVEIVSPCQVL